MTPTRAWLLAVLAAVLLLAAPSSAPEAQQGRSRRPAPPPAEEPAPRERAGPGAYSVELRQVLEAVNRGEGRQALAEYERLVAEAERHGDRLLAARANVAAAMAALRLGVYRKTIQSGIRAIDVFKTVDLSSDLLTMTAAYTHVGTAYRQVGDAARAREVFEEGLRFVESRRGERGSSLALARLSVQLSYFAEAEGDHQTALARAALAAKHSEDAASRVLARAPERLLHAPRREAAKALLAMGKAQRALGRLDEADASLDRALKLSRQIGLRELETDVLLNQGAVALSRQDWPKAVSLHQQGVALASQIDRARSLMWLNDGLGRAFDGLGRTAEALAAAREAVRHLEAIREGLAEAGLRSGFVEDKQLIYQRAVRLALKAHRPDEAFALVEHSRARAFLDLLGGQTTLSKGKTRALVDEEVRLRARLGEARALTSDEDVSDDPAGARPTVEAAQREYRAFLERVRKESLEQASLMTVEPVTLGEIQSLLPEGTTLLEYLAGREDTILWVVDRQRTTVVRLAGDYASLVDQVRRFRGAIASAASLAVVEGRAQTLYRRLVEPARSAIGGDRLLIVPHGALHYLPFGALRSPAGRWLAEDFALTTLPSASVLRYLGGKGAHAPTRALAVGNPDTGASLDLRWAEREARLIGQQMADATVLVRADATESRVKQLVESAGLIHFATHGELDEADPLSSALLLVPGGGEDGRLEVRELFGLDLRARLVVLSACETGLGKLVRGDELVGLQRAFLYAGTPAVVTTLWKVDDHASYDLMRAFYGHLEQDGAAQALRKAQLETMRTYPHPFAWAGFGLTGLPR